MSSTESLRQLVGQPRPTEVEDVELRIAAVRVCNLPEAIEMAATIIAMAFAGGGAEDVFPEDAEEVLDLVSMSPETAQVVFDFYALMSGQSSEWISELPTGELKKLIKAVFDVNTDFFGQRLPRHLRRMRMLATRGASSFSAPAPSSGSPTPTDGFAPSTDSGSAATT